MFGILLYVYKELRKLHQVLLGGGPMGKDEEVLIKIDILQVEQNLI